MHIRCQNYFETETLDWQCPSVWPFANILRMVSFALSKFYYTNKCLQHNSTSIANPYQNNMWNDTKMKIQRFKTVITSPFNIAKKYRGVKYHLKFWKSALSKKLEGKYALDSKFIRSSGQVYEVLPACHLKKHIKANPIPGISGHCGSCQWWGRSKEAGIVYAGSEVSESVTSNGRVLSEVQGGPWVVHRPRVHTQAVPMLNCGPIT